MSLDRVSNSGLSIGELAERTQVSVATLRAWERRYGFPVPMRLPSGHRRYAAGDIARIREVVRRRAEGARLDAAIERVRDIGRPTDGSVFASLRREYPYLPVERLHKSTLVALSWAIEDEFCAKADRARIFGGFQHARHYRSSQRRWEDLGRLAASAFVFADFDDDDLVGGARGEVIRVGLGPESPLRREWLVTCDSDDSPVTLVAWELPGQESVPDPQRLFEAIWTIEPGPVRTAARICAAVAAGAHPDEAAHVLATVAAAPEAGEPDLASLNTMFTRVLRYVDRHGAHADRL
ncbi:DICT sensory domain-containing protein [Nocardioides mangrovi]|uniref:MerR family DNA-binding transcriptional regulator n=1 Tax=Nocardioides mangrovi TaxID=2874580 RepID=A0ABS7UDR0_9ACTN|nr:DICT sensory domain-containing protein [Nocardioides mangrovi]MBZ5738846.1 MerR family DNA-binding transcriptional regulator [Nocardioides mangrovi]